MRGVLADVTPLRVSADFRRLWVGELVSLLGSQLTLVAVPFQVFQITHSSLAVGLVGLVSLGPLLVCSLVGGAVADAVDRRRLLIVMEVLLALCSAGLAVNSLGGRPRLWPLFVASALSAGFSGVELPTRNAAVATLLPAELLSAANALWQILFQTSIVVGPALSGLLLGTAGASVVYLVDVGTYGAAAVSVLLIRPMLPEGGGTRAGARSIGEGLRFLRGHRLLVGTFVIDIDAMVFGMPRALFPALAADFYHVGPLGLGLLYAAPGAGALVGAVTTGWVSRVERQGRAVLLAVGAWALAVTGFGLVPSISMAMVFLALAGAADVVSAVFRNTILQQAVPDRLRGRLSAVHVAVVTGGPRVGDFESGAVASLTTPQFSAVTGGLACLAGVGLIARLMPELDRYRTSSLPTATEAAPPGQPPVTAAPVVPIQPADPPPQSAPAIPIQPADPPHAGSSGDSGTAG